MKTQKLKCIVSILQIQIILKEYMRTNDENSVS